MGFKKKNLMSLWKGLMSLCMVWLNCLFAIFFVVCLVLLGCMCRNVCSCICFYFWGLCSPCVSLSPYSTCRFIFLLKTSIFVLNPPALFHPPHPPIRQRAMFAKAVIHTSKVDKTNYHRPQKLSTPASSLKSPPTSSPSCRRLRRQIPHRWSRVLRVAQDPVGS